MKLLAALLLFCLGTVSAQTVYYVSPSGNDANTGTSLAQAWATVSHAAAQQNAGVIGPGSTVTVEAGTYADSISIVNSTVVGSGTTPTYPLPSSGTAIAPIQWVANGVVNIDAADVVPSLTWTSVGSGVYSATFTTHPNKLFVDDNNLEIPQLQPSGNMTGVYSPSTSYNEYDIATQGSATTVTVTTAGSGMTPGTYALTFTGGGSPSRVATGNAIVASNGVTVTISGLYGGRGYTSAPTVTFSPGGTPAVLTASLTQLPYIVAPNNFNVVNQMSGTGWPWVAVSFPSSTIDSYTFSATNTGIQNVTANPGSWYIAPSGSNWTVYVHLADGSSPSGHTLKATHRDQNLVLSSVDYVNFTGFTFEHAMEQCVYMVAALNSQAGGNYYSGEFNQVASSSIFNCGNIGGVHDTLGTGLNLLMGGLVVRPGAETNPHFLRPAGPFSLGNYFGTVDGLYGSGSNLQAGLILAAVDGGGNAFTPLAWGDTISTKNTIGVMSEPSDVTTSVGGNLGGTVAYETCTNSIQCFQLGVIGGNYHHNFLHDYKGQGFQIGGSGSVSTASQPLLIHHNVIANAGQAPYNAGYNGIDANGGTAGQFGVYEFNNTIFNTPDACSTFESGLQGSHYYNNICDMNAQITQTGTNVWVAPGNGYGGTNGSSYLYFILSSQTNADFHNNHYYAACGTYTAGCAGNKFAGYASCATWPAYWPETGFTYCEDKNPLFTNVAGGTTTANDFRLQTGSPDIGVGPVITVQGVSSTPDLGAIAYGQTFPFVVPAIGTTSFQVI